MHESYFYCTVPYGAGRFPFRIFKYYVIRHSFIVLFSTIFVKDDSALAAFLYKSEMFLHNFIIPVSTITQVGCFTFDMETFKVNRDLYNFVLFQVAVKTAVRWRINLKFFRIVRSRKKLRSSQTLYEKS
jgi:hypothetical protein